MHLKWQRNHPRGNKGPDSEVLHGQQIKPEPNLGAGRGVGTETQGTEILKAEAPLVWGRHQLF